ncbi:expressed unknown protein [Seminavis robusta]|uniref:Uncharacterized protein n=1 Tax=Seminavis robusta TaxID=568900 RepID=A0A9N8H956_9STRA|nr:expressed unknown protein [Seminavis robusta]|eukprot:Sro108_g054180.1 n/a (86) ;mRNA; f:54659-55354
MVVLERTKRVFADENEGNWVVFCLAKRNQTKTRRCQHQNFKMKIVMVCRLFQTEKHCQQSSNIRRRLGMSKLGFSVSDPSIVLRL